MRLTVDPSAGTPAYEQIARQIADAAAQGRVASGTKLPTVRQLAGDLGLATNTVARAYRDLEAAGVVTTNRRNGTVVATPPAAAEDEEVTAAAVLFVRAARRAGLSPADAAAIIRGAW